MSRALIFLALLLPLPALALVNINSAGLEELDTLPGVGPSIAQKIVDARPFSNTSEIQNVQGIGGPGSKTYDDIIGLITINGEIANVEIDESQESSDTDKSSSSVSGEVVVKERIHGLELTAPEVTFVGQLAKFSVLPQDGDKDRLVRYRWNFGDGTLVEGKSVEHIYKYPGDYLVIVESYYLKETKLSEVHIKVLTPNIRITSLSGAVSLKNESDYDMDLSGMSLRSADWSFKFPDHSWILSEQTLTLDSGLVAGESYLYDSTGKPVVSEQKVTTVTAKVFPTPRISAISTAAPVIDESPIVSDVAIEKFPDANEAAVINADLPQKKWPYVGLFLVIVFGLYTVMSFSKTV